MNDSLRKCLLLLCISSGLLCATQAQELIDFQLKGSFTQQQLALQYGPLVQNGVRLYKLRYTTLDVQGVPDTASGLLIVPIRSPSQALPLLCAMHGTVDSRSDVPSNLQGGYELGVVFGGLGYVTAMPDYLGLGDSRGFHPYVHAASEASAGVDMLFAARMYAAQQGLLLNEQVFVTGYSQGGHAAMALHQTLEQDYPDEFSVTAAAPLSGPYSISTVMRSLILGEEPYNFVAYVPYTLLSYDLAYGLFERIEDAFKEPYAAWIKEFRQEGITLSTLNDRLIMRLTQDVGAPIARYMFQDSVLNEVATNLEHPFNIALSNNDTYRWAPIAPTRLFYCQADDQVPFRNSVVADSVMNLLGAVDVLSNDVNPMADHGGCVFPAVLNTVLFFAAYQQIITSVATRKYYDVLDVYPNPAREVLFIRNAPDQALAQLFDSSGRLQRSTQLQNGDNYLNISGLQNGLYVLRLTTAAGIQTGKVLISQ